MAKGEPRKPSEFVYFVQAETLRLIKIGVAKNMKERLWALQCGSPDKLTLLGIARYDRPAYVESLQHTEFQEDRAHGEWFRPSSALLKLIAEDAVSLERDVADQLDAAMVRIGLKESA